MAFDWNTYIQLGKELCNQDRPETIRAGISRGYYGLYNILRIYEGLTTRYRPHKDLIDKLAKAEKFDEEIELAKYLEDIKEYREKADYDGVINIDKAYSDRFWIRLDFAFKLFLENKV